MFEVGKEVVCIKSHPDNVVKKGSKYIVIGIKKGCAHHPIMLDVGAVHPKNRTVCPMCGYAAEGAVWLNASRFAPIDNTLSDTTVEEILTEIGELEF